MTSQSLQMHRRRMWFAGIFAYTAALLIEDVVVYPLLIYPQLPDIWDMSWSLRVAYAGPELLVCLVAGALMWSGRSVVLFGLASSTVRTVIYTFQALRGAEGYLQAGEELHITVPIMLIVMAAFYSGVAALGRASRRGLVRAQELWRSK